MSELAISIIVGLVDIIFSVLCILLFIYSRKLGKLSEINRNLERAYKLCKYAEERVKILDRKIYRQEQISRQKKQVEELARSIALEIDKNCRGDDEKWNIENVNVVGKSFY